MNYYFTTTNSRHDLLSFEIDEPFKESLVTPEERNTFRGQICVFCGEENSSESGEPIALVEMVFIDGDAAKEDGYENAFCLADVISGDLAITTDQLINSPIYNEEEINPPYICYIDRLIVDSSYRGNGIGTYLIENLEQLCVYLFNAYVHCFTTYPEPDHPEGGWKNESDEITARKRLVLFLEKNGFSDIGEGVYGKQVNV